MFGRFVCDCGRSRNEDIEAQCNVFEGVFSLISFRLRCFDQQRRVATRSTGRIDREERNEQIIERKGWL